MGLTIFDGDRIVTMVFKGVAYKRSVAVLATVASVVAFAAPVTAAVVPRDPRTSVGSGARSGPVPVLASKAVSGVAIPGIKVGPEKSARDEAGSGKGLVRLASVSNSPTTGTFYDGSHFVAPSPVPTVAPNGSFVPVIGSVSSDATPIAQFAARSFSYAVTYVSTVPEPATWAMMIVGFGMVGFGLRRAVRRSEIAFDEKIKRIAAGLED